MIQHTRVKISVRGIFNKRDIELLIEGLENHRKNIRDYGETNYKDMQIAKQQITKDNCSEIAMVNWCKSKNNNDLYKYPIVIFIVPEESEKNEKSIDIMNKIKNWINNGVAKDNGILPVLICPEYTKSIEWNSFIELAEKSGNIYPVKMKNLRFQMI